MYYDHKRPNGKNDKLWYYVPSFAKMMVPNIFYRGRLRKKLKSIDRRQDRDYILDRVAYYNKLEGQRNLSDKAVPLSGFKLKGHNSTYFFDTYEYTRWFDGRLKFDYLFGDITHVPDYPSVLKSRPIAGDNANSVLLNLDKVRHFTFMNDRKSFRDKMDMAIFRGQITLKPHRIQFVEKYFGHPMCDAGVIDPEPHFPAEWSEDKSITLWKHLDYKFIMAIEGNEVASNLKWIMSSNSVAVMPRPRYESWFMEGRLIPNVHYIEIKGDYSDLPDRLNYYINNPDEAEKIIENAHRYVEQFLNPERERLISLKVLEKYFAMTGQSDIPTVL